MESKNTLKKNIMSLVVLQGSNYLLPLISLPYLVRVLGPEKFGLIAFVQAVMQYFVMLVDYGFNWSATKKIAANRSDSASLSVITSGVYAVKSLLAVVAGAILMTMFVIVPGMRAEFWLWGAAFSGVIGSIFFPVWFFQGMEKMGYITHLSIGARLITTIAIFSLVKRPADYALAAFLLAVAPAIAGLFAIALITMKFRVRLRISSINVIIDFVKEGRDVFLATLATSLYTSSNAIIVGVFLNNQAVGYFSGADRIVKAFVNLLTPVSQAIYPRIGSLVTESKALAVDFIGKCLFWMSITSLTLSVLLLLAAKPMVLLVLGSEYLPAVTLVRCMSPLPFFIVISNIFGFQTMLNFGLQKEFRQTILIVGLTNLFLMSLLVYFFGVTGAASASVIAEMFVAVLAWFALKRAGITLPLFFSVRKLSNT